MEADWLSKLREHLLGMSASQSDSATRAQRLYQLRSCATDTSYRTVIATATTATCVIAVDNHTYATPAFVMGIAAASAGQLDAGVTWRWLTQPEQCSWLALLHHSQATGAGITIYTDGSRRACVMCVCVRVRWTASARWLWLVR